jgi:hypothetical protein
MILVTMIVVNVGKNREYLEASHPVRCQDKLRVPTFFECFLFLVFLIQNIVWIILYLSFNVLRFLLKRGYYIFIIYMELR